MSRLQDSMNGRGLPARGSQFRDTNPPYVIEYGLSTERKYIRLIGTAFDARKTTA